MQNDFEKLLAICNETGRLYEPGLIFIGGIAVYLHSINREHVAPYAEATKDADVYISLAGFSDMRDIEEMSQNARLSKHEFQKGGFSFDVYTERQSSLPIPYAEIAAHAHEFSGVFVAAPEHLLVLKLEAAVDRHGSEHGRKDAKDVIRLLLVSAGTLNAELAVKFMKDDHLNHLHSILNGPEFVALAKGNSQMAKRLRRSCEDLVSQIDKAFHGTAPENDNAPEITAAQRIKALPSLQKATGAALTFYGLASVAISESNGNTKKVNWTAVEDATIAKSIGENGQTRDSVLKALKTNSPGTISAAQQASLEERIQKFAANSKPARSKFTGPSI